MNATGPRAGNDSRPSPSPLVTAALALASSAVILGPLYHWFAVADRYAVFLYGHLGATPFDAVTSSRYWMAGLVAAGVLLVCGVAANWLAGRFSSRFVPPDWRTVWLWAAALSAPGAAAIVLFGGEPRLPIESAAACCVTVTAGLALAVMPFPLAATAPRTLVWDVLHGLAVTPLLLLVRVLELPARLASVSVPLAFSVAGGSLVASALGLALLAVIGRRIGRAVPKPAVSLAAGFAVSYLALPLVHHLLATPPGFRYVSASANFFAQDWGLQLVSWAIAGALAVASGRLGRRF